MQEFIKTLKELPKSFLIGSAVIAFAVIFFWFVFLKSVISDIETITYDWRSRIAAHQIFSRHDDDIVLLAAGDHTSKVLERYPELKIGRWPWQRKVWGDVVNYVSKGNPKAIIFDIKFEGTEGALSENIASDKYFAEAVKGKNVVIGVALTSSRAHLLRNAPHQVYFENNLDEQIYKQLEVQIPALKEKFELRPLGDYYAGLPLGSTDRIKFFDNITFYSVNTIFEDLYNNVSGLGSVNLKSSENVVFRHHIPLYRLVHEGGISYLPSLPLAAVLASIPEDERTPVFIEKNKIIIGKRSIYVDDYGKFLINWHGPAGTYDTIPVSRVILGDAVEKRQVHNVTSDEIIAPIYFKDKIVVIGQTSAGTDIHPTSMQSVYPGPEIITTAIDNLLNDTDTSNPKRRTFIKRANWGFNFAVMLLFCFLINLAIRKTPSNLQKIERLLLIFIAFVSFVLVLFISPAIRISANMTYPFIFMIITAASTYSYKMYLENQERKYVENLFGKFVSPQVLDKLLKEKKTISQEGQRKIMTVLFSDIRGFTTLSENYSPDEVIVILNEYLTEMVEVILKHNGTLDKYIGDAIMAFYNDPIEMEDHALNAVLTAVEMKETLERLNEKWKAEGKPVLNMGIGINTGEMIVGHMGSPRLVDYTVIGDNVNLASRVEGLTKEYGVNIIISESTYNEVKNHVEAVFLDECVVKGRHGSVRIYEVKGLKSKIS